MSKFNKDELNPPEWLTNKFFEKALKHFFKQDQIIEIKSLDITPATTAEEHFASIMFKAEIIFDTPKKSANKSFLILKTVPTEEGVKMDFMKDSCAFRTEMGMYEKVLPEMEKILSEAGIHTTIAPKLVYQSNDPAPVIVMEDLTPKGFKTYDSFIDFDHAKTIFLKIAKFHACSMYMVEKGHDLTKFNETYYQPHPEKPDYAEEYLLPGLKAAIDEVSKWPGCDFIVEKMKCCMKTFTKQLTKLHLEQEGQKYKVLTQGDMHFKNMLYRNDGVKDEDLILIDYQFSLWTTPAIEILGLFYGVVSKNDRELRRDELIQIYFNDFITTLEKLNYKGQFPRLLDLHLELLRCSILEFMMLVNYSPFQYINWSDMNMLELMENKDFYGPTKLVWKNSEFKKYFLKVVNRLITIGALD